jgi:DNA (cytosine-5)-methyltransferase 1
VTAYYNENDPFCAGWLRNLVAAGHIAPGDVDDRDIRDVSPDDLRGYGQCHFFAGIGLWSQALRWAGWPDDRPVWTGSCPCQPFSAAGRGAGFADDRHLWPAWEWLIAQRRPVAIVGEQVGSPAGLLWLDVVSAGLEGLGYSVGAVDVPSAGVGAPNIRQRLWWVADANPKRRDGGGRGQQVRRHGHEPANGCGLGDALLSGLEGYGRHGNGGGQPQRLDPHEGRPAASPGPPDPWRQPRWIDCLDGKRRPAEPGVFPLAARHPGDVARLRAYGNAINPIVAAHFIRAVMDIV